MKEKHSVDLKGGYLPCDTKIKLRKRSLATQHIFDPLNNTSSVVTIETNTSNEFIRVECTSTEYQA